MRTKSESRRNTILDAAFQVFLENGFSAASMSEISARVGGSKATLYSYFASKEELFVAVIHQFAEDQFADLLGMLDLQADLAVSLEEFGACFIKLVSHPDLIRMYRNVVGESSHSEIGRMFYVRGPEEIHKEVSLFLQKCMEQGKLRQADSHIAAQHLVGLLYAEMRDATLFGILENPDETAIQAASQRAIEVFLRGYAVPGTVIT